MRQKKICKIIILVCVIAMSFSFVVGAEWLGAGKAEWTGYEKNGYLYSKIKDVKKDGYRNYGTVYVQNDKGQRKFKPSHTTGVNTSFYAKIKATHSNPVVVERAWYTGYYTNRVTGE